MKDDALHWQWAKWKFIGHCYQCRKTGAQEESLCLFSLFFFLIHIHKTVKSEYWLCHVCPYAWNSTSPSIQQIFMKLIFEYFFKFCQENSSVIKIWPVTAALHEDLCTFVMISRWILLRMRNVSDKHSIENKNMFYVQELLFWIVPFMR